MLRKYALGRASIVLPFLNTMQQYGKDPQSALNLLGIDYTMLTNSRLYLPSYSLGHLIDCSAKLTNCNNIGIISGHSTEAKALHPKFTELLEPQETLLDALLTLSQWQHLQGSHFALEIQYVDKELRIYHASALLSSHRGFNHSHLFTTTRLIQFIRKYQGTNWKPDYIALQSDIEDTTLLAQSCQMGRVLVGQPRSYVPINYPIGMMNIARTTRSDNRSIDVLEQVKVIINALWTTENFSLDLVAHLFGISERTIQRAFTDNGDTFRNYINNLKVAKAKQLLLQGRNVAQIAEQLKYTEPANLSRAIKKQTGLSPTQYTRYQSKCFIQSSTRTLRQGTV